MGQYYTPVIMKSGDAANLQSFYSHDYDNGLKLMEHSYIGNNFVATVLCSLEEGDRLLWVGDYAEPDDLSKNPDHIITDAAFDACIEEGDKMKHKQTLSKEMIVWRRFVVNATKKEYIDLEAYKEWAPKDKWGYIIHPIPLLTSVGNGKGGGDYWGDYSSDAVGSWAGDEIYATDELGSAAEYRNASYDYLFYEGQLTEEQEAKYYDED